MADQRFRELQRRAAEDPNDGEAQVRLFGEQIRHGQVEWATAIAAISAVPEDDSPRFLFADYLEAQGDARGEYIRVQCELAAGPFLSKRRGLIQRGQALFRKHSRHWIAALGARGRWTWNRGFVASAALSSSELIKHETTLFGREPIDSLAVSQCGVTLKAIAGRDFLPRLRVLRLRGDLKQESIDLLSQQQLPRLRRLNLGDSRLKKLELSALFQSPSLARLESLSLSGNGLTAKHLEGLRDSEQSLTSLYLSRNQLTDRALEIIGDSPSCKTLERLALPGNGGLTSQGVRRFLSSETVKSLKWLDLGGLSLEDHVVNELRMRIRVVNL